LCFDYAHSKIKIAGDDKMDLIKIGRIISEARKKKGFTQKELASKLHISDKAISKWERGLGSPDISFIIPLSQLLDISLYQLLSGEKEEVEETIKNTIRYSNKEKRRLFKLFHVGIFQDKNSYKRAEIL